MKKFLLLLGLAMFGFGDISAQEVLWASDVIEFSSELSSPQFSARQILDKPDALLATSASERISPNAWMPTPGEKIDFITVSFEKKMPLQQVAIAESYNPSALWKIYGYDSQGKEFLLIEFNPKVLPLNGRLFRAYFEKTSFDVHALKLVFKSFLTGGKFGVDAVGVSDSKIPISVQINLSNQINDFFQTEPLSDNVNSPYLELKPLISPDNSTLFFSRRNHPGNVGGVRDDEDIWFAEKGEDGKWNKAKNIGWPLNNNGPNFISSVSPDGGSILVLLGNQYKGKQMRSGLSISQKTTEGWTEPEAVQIDDYYNLSPRANYFLANNQKILIMAIERDDSRGDRDLYVSHLKEDGGWSRPLNLGNIVNSADEEAAPHLAADDKTLFFSSKGFNGFGGYDIYLTKRLDDTWLNWSEPENLGSTINSPVDDIFFNLSLVDEFAYFSRGTTEDVDIYRAALPQYQRPDIVVTVKGRVLNSLTKAPLEAIIRYERLYDGKEIGLAHSDSISGKYQIILPYGYQYGYFAEKKGFIPISANIDLSKITESMEIEKDLYLMPIQNEPTPITLNNVFFKFDKAELIETSFPELNRLVKLLTENENMNIEISGHTCSMGSDAYNQNLSERRAKAIEDYLVSNGIEIRRLTALGYGESMPKASNETEEGRRFNRRVEFRIMRNDAVSSSMSR